MRNHEEKREEEVARFEQSQRFANALLKRVRKHFDERPTTFGEWLQEEIRRTET